MSKRITEPTKVCKTCGKNYKVGSTALVICPACYKDELVKVADKILAKLEEFKQEIQNLGS